MKLRDLFQKIEAIKLDILREESASYLDEHYPPNISELPREEQLCSLSSEAYLDESAVLIWFSEPRVDGNLVEVGEINTMARRYGICMSPYIDRFKVEFDKLVNTGVWHKSDVMDVRAQINTKIY